MAIGCLLIYFDEGKKKLGTQTIEKSGSARGPTRRKKCSDGGNERDIRCKAEWKESFLSVQPRSSKRVDEIIWNLGKVSLFQQ